MTQTDHSRPYPNLFQPITIGTVRLKNRIVMPPMGCRHDIGGVITDADIAWHEERAAGGVGLIITGGTFMHETSVMRGDPGIHAWLEHGLKAMTQRVDAVHSHGCKVIGQMLHLGRETTEGQADWAQPAPSAVRSPRDAHVPYAMDTDEIAEFVRAFGLCAANMRKAGYDGMEIHAAHGYLIAQFLSVASNRRTDAYGGSTVRERMRFLLEISDEVRRQCGDEFTVGVRLSATEDTPGGITLDQTKEMVAALQENGAADYISITRGMRNWYVKDNTWPQGVSVDLAAAIKEECDLPVLVTGRITAPAYADSVVADSKADLIGVGRGLIADPEWAAKARGGLAEPIRPCVGFVQDCRMSAGGATCAVNAAAGREVIWAKPSLDIIVPRRRIVIAGAGPGGMEAARLAALLGHDVVVFERDDKVGGQLRRAARAPFRAELMGFADYLEAELARLGVDTRLGTGASADSVSAEVPDLVIIATGSVGEPVPAELADASFPVLSVWDLMDVQERDLGRRVVLVDDGTGFWQGAGAADFLVDQDVELTFVTPAAAIGSALPLESIHLLHRRLRSAGAIYRPFTRLAGVSGDVVRLKDTITEEESELHADAVVLLTGQRSVNELADELRSRELHVRAIGDAVSPRRITHAVLDANKAVRGYKPVTAARHHLAEQLA